MFPENISRIQKVSEIKKVGSLLNGYADLMRFAFFSPKDSSQPEMPKGVVTITPLRIETEGDYQINREEDEIPYIIRMSSRWINRPLWEQCETLAHQLTHIYDELILGGKGSKDYHHKELINLCEDLGLNLRIGKGYHYKPATGQFANLMNQLGIELPEYARDDVTVPENSRKLKNWWDFDRGIQKGSSTLVLYTGENCPNKQPCKVRSGKSNLEIACKTCGSDFIAQK